MASQVEDLPFNYQIEFFDMLLMNADRNGDNFLVDQPFSPQTPQEIYERADQILIDNEKIFQFNPLLWHPNKQDLIHFITRTLLHLYAENPEMAQLLAKPKTESQIVALIKASALPSKSQAIDHVQIMLGLYQSIYAQMIRRPQQSH
jgi:hypothetical protein